MSFGWALGPVLAWCGQPPPNLPAIKPSVLSAARLAADLSVAGRARVTVGQPLADSAVFFYENGVPLSRAVDGFAQCLHATATRTSDGYLIHRRPSDILEADSRRRALVASWLRRKIAAVRKYRQQTVGSGSVAAAFQTEAAAGVGASAEIRAGGIDRSTGFFPQLLLPPEALLESLAERIGFDKLASTPSGTAAVFEDDPVPGAVALPKHDDLIGQYAINVKHAGHPLPLTGSGLAALQGIAPPEVAAYPDGPALKKDRLRLSCWMSPNQAVVTLEAFDASGKRNLWATLLAGASQVLHHPRQITKDAQLQGASTFGPLSEDSLAALRSLPTGREETIAPPHDLPSWVADPVKVDPLNLWVRDALVGIYGSVPQRCVAISVPDQLWSLTQMCVTPRGLCVKAWKQALEEWLPLDVVTTPDLLVVRPIDYAFADATHADRKVLLKFAGNNAPLHDAGVRNVAELVARASPMHSDLSVAWVRQCDELRLVRPDVLGLGGDLLRFIAAIQDSDWARLLAGTTMTVGQLGAEPELHRMLMGDASVAYAQPAQRIDLFKHPLEFVGSRDLGDCLVSIQPVQAPMLRVANNGAVNWSSLDQFSTRFSITAGSIKFRDGVPVMPLTRAEFESKASAVSVQMATLRGIRLRIALGAGATIDRQIGESIGDISPTMSYAQLPEKLRDSVWDHVVDRAVTLATGVHIVTSDRSGPGKSVPP